MSITLTPATSYSPGPRISYAPSRTTWVKLWLSCSWLTVTTSASIRGSLSPIAGGYGSVTTAAPRPRSRKQPCPSQVTSTGFVSLHPLGSAYPHQVERGLQSVTCGAAQLQPGSGQFEIVDDDAVLRLRVARVVEAMDRGRQVVHVIRNAVRLQQKRRILDDVRPERELAGHFELPGLLEQ